MTKYLLFLFIFLATPLAFAQDFKKINYIEVGLGFLIPSDVSTEPYSGTSPSGDITYNNLRANIEYDHPIAWSFEYGRYFNKDLNLRAGLNYTLSKAKLKRIYGTGSYTYNGITYNISDSLDRSEANNAESFDNNFKILSANLYKDFNQLNLNFTPFIGLGIGLADIEDTKDKEMVSSLIVGFNYDLYDATYIGGKFLYNTVSGPTNNDGLKYEDIDFQTWLIQIGRRF